MIEFKGSLTGNALKRLRENYFILFSSIISAATITGGVIISYIIGIEDIEHLRLVILLLTPVYLFSCIIVPYLFMKFDKSHIPKQITIKDGIISCVTDQIGTDSRKIEQIKIVKEYSDHYYIICKGLNIPPHFICQKDLLTQGTIEEFESLFAGKIKKCK